MRKERRQHLHQTIERHGLDMTHVTERKGSPQTLVCTKNRRTYQRQSDQYKADVDSFCELAKTLRRASGVGVSLSSRMAEARNRAGNWAPSQ